MLNRKKILIVDDDKLNLDFFELMLSKLGFAVEKASDGKEAMEKITASSPDLILLETVLPKISGWEILKSVRKDNELLPILLMSKISDVKDIVDGFELGADDYVVKPFNFSVLLARIRAALRNRVLITQIIARENRLNLAEKMNSNIKAKLSEFQKSLSDLKQIIGTDKKTDAVLAEILDLKDRLSQMENEWKGMKEKEIGITILEKPIRDTVSY
ncbi:hypothetical protein AGMMS50212_07440 [Spirochaetia bacterium]|nr:hypothetical protein AGMMS50212_07440 [Spirochaetia bacterium]